MKFYLEIVKETFIPSSDPLQKKEIKVETIISSTKFSTKAKAEKAIKIKSLSKDQTKRIHQCYHDETNPKPCVII